MERIASYERFQALAASAPKRAITNFFMLPPQIKELIADGALFYQAQDRPGFLLYVEFHQYYKLYYTITPGNAPAVPSQDKPVIVDLIYNERKPLSQEFYAWLDANGFGQIASYRQWSVGQAELVCPAESILAKEGLRLIPGQLSHIPEILALLREAFGDSLTDDLPGEMNLIRTLSEEKAVCLLADSGTVYGYAEASGHVAVSSKARGKGLGRILLCEAVKLSGLHRFYCWIKEENTASEKMSASLGFKLTEKRLQKWLQT